MAWSYFLDIMELFFVKSRPADWLFAAISLNPAASGRRGFFWAARTLSLLLPCTLGETVYFFSDEKTIDQ
jgi:hypothetical protein